MAGQDVYDDEVFFAGYQQLRVVGTGYNEAMEQPALRALVPSIEALTLLIWVGGRGHVPSARRRGTRNVLGVDPSARMLELARSRTPRTTWSPQFREAFAEDLVLPAHSVHLWSAVWRSSMSVAKWR